MGADQLVIATYEPRHLNEVLELAVRTWPPMLRPLLPENVSKQPFRLR